MAVDEQIDRLSQQLDKDSIPSVDTLTDDAVAKLAMASAAIIGWLRHYAHERPLVTMLLSCQLGYLIGRFGGRRARR